MKKIIVFIIGLLFVLTLTGCKEKITDNGDNNKTNGNNIAKEFSISDDWTDLEFVLGNEKYSFPLFYKDLSSKGWQMNENEDLPAKESTFKNYEMWNSGFYDEALDLYAYIYVDFHNYEDEAKKIRDCPIWSIGCYRIDEEISAMGYEIRLAKGIKWGSTEEEILAAYGPVEEGYRIESGEIGCILVYYTPIENMMIQMNLHIDYESGLFMAELMQYPLE